MKKMLQFMCVVFMGLMASACANKNIPAPFTPTDLNSKVTSGEYVQKVDNFILLFDDSASMEYKIRMGKLIATNMNNTIPTLQLQSGFRVFCPVNYPKDSPVKKGMTAYNKSDYGTVIDSVLLTPGGNTPMSDTINTANKDLTDTKGDIAVIVISDGLANVGGPAEVAAQQLKEQYKERVCIYTILIGDDAAGRATMEKVAKAGECGFATDQEALSTPAGMASFVERVFLKKADKVAAPVVVVPAAKQCFTVELKVEFDFDKSTIRPEYYKTLTDFGDFIRKYPEHTVNLEGHTDNFGTDQYNKKLSQRRADSVRAFLLKNFSDIDSARLTTVAHGLSQPIADNSTKDGRQKNRRVFATFTSMK